MITDAHRGALDAIDRLVNRGFPRDETLEAAADILRARFPDRDRVEVRPGAVVLEPVATDGDREFLERAARMLDTVA